MLRAGPARPRAVRAAGDGGPRLRRSGARATTRRWPAWRADALVVMEESTLEHYRSARRARRSGCTCPGFSPGSRSSGSATRLRTEGRDTARAALRAEVVAAQPGFARFDPSRPTLLFIGGSAWTYKTGRCSRRPRRPRRCARRPNVVVVAGRDRAFETRLRPRASDGLHVFGFVAPEVLAALMGLAQVPVLGSLAPATLQELLEVGLGPLLLFHFIPGSERAHVGYIDAQRLGLYAPDTSEMLHRIREMLGLGLPPISSRAPATASASGPGSFARAASSERCSSHASWSGCWTRRRSPAPARAPSASGAEERVACAPRRARCRPPEDRTDRPIAVALVEAQRVQLRRGP